MAAFINLRHPATSLVTALINSDNLTDGPLIFKLFDIIGTE